MDRNKPTVKAVGDLSRKITSSVIASFEVTDLLPRLVDRSLVNYDEATGRYSLLETVRQYAQEITIDSGDSGQTRERHLAHYSDFLSGMRTRLRGPDQLMWLERLDAEFDNIRSAFEWSIASDDHWSTALKFARNLTDYWMIRGLLIEATNWMRQLEMRRSGMNASQTAILLAVGGQIRAYRGNVDIEKSEEAVAYARESKDEAVLGLSLSNLIADYISQDRALEAEKLAPEATRLLANSQDHVNEGRVWMQLGNAAFTRGDLDTAEKHYHKCLELRRRSGDLRGTGSVLGSLGDVYERRGDAEAAHKHLRMAIGAFMSVRSLWDLAGGLPSLCAELLQTGRPNEAAEVLGCADALLASLGAARDSADTDIYERWVRDVRAAMGPDKFKEFYLRGRSTPFEAVIRNAFPDGLDELDLSENVPFPRPVQ